MAKYPEVKLTPKRIAPQEVKIWTEYSAGLYSIGHITEEEYRLVLHAQMPVDSLGRLWTIGVDSGKWYRLDEGEWVPDIPPLTLYMMVPEDALKQLEREDEAKYKQAIADIQSKRAARPPVKESAPPPKPVEEAAPVEEKPPAQIPDTDERISCEKCGTENPAAAKFCTGCGQPLQKAAPSEITCPECGTENPPGASFCMNCGNPLKE